MSLFSIPPFLWALLSALGISAWSILSRRILRNEKDYLAVGGINEWLSVVVISVMVLALGADLGDSRATDLSTIPQIGWIALGAAIVLYTIFTFLNYKAFQSVEATERAVLSQIQVAWVVLLGVLFFSESLPLPKLLAICLVVAGGVLCTYRKTQHRWKVEGVQLIVLASLISGTATIADKVAIGHFPIILYSLVLFLVPAIVALVLMGKKSIKRMEAVWKRHGTANVVVLALASSVPYIALLIALRVLPVSELVPLINTNIIFTAIGSMILLGEHEGWPQKILGALLALVGASMLGSV